MLKLWYARRKGVEVVYFSDPQNEGDFTFTEPLLDEIKQLFYLRALGHRSPVLKGTTVSDMVWNNPGVVKYLLNTPELMVVQLRYLEGLNCYLDDVVLAWEKGGKITLPNPFYIGEHND